MNEDEVLKQAIEMSRQTYEAEMKKARESQLNPNPPFNSQPVTGVPVPSPTWGYPLSPIRGPNPLSQPSYMNSMNYPPVSSGMPGPMGMSNTSTMSTINLQNSMLAFTEQIRLTKEENQLVMERLKTLEDVHNLTKSEWESTVKALQEQERQTIVAEEKLSRAVEKMVEMQKKISQFEKNSDKKVENENLQIKLAQSNEQQKFLTDQIDSLKKHTSALNEKIHQLESIKNSDVKTITDLKSQNERLALDLSENNKTGIENIKKLKEELSVSRQEYESLNKKLLIYEKQVEETKSKLEESLKKSKTLEKIESENNHLINQINILAQSKNTQNNEMDNLHKKIIDYSKMIKNLESNLDQTEAELTSLKQNMAFFDSKEKLLLTQEIDKLKSEKEKLLEMVDETDMKYESEKAEKKKLLDSLKVEQLMANQTVNSQLTEVQKQLEVEKSLKESIKSQYLKDKTVFEDHRKLHSTQLSDLRKERDNLQHYLKKIGASINELESHYPPLPKDTSNVSYEDQALASIQAINTYLLTHQQTTVSVGNFYSDQTVVFHKNIQGHFQMIQVSKDDPLHFLDPDCTQEFSSEIKLNEPFFARVVYISEPNTARDRDNPFSIPVGKMYRLVSVCRVNFG